MIVTLAEVKQFLQIIVNTYDALITALIPEAEGIYESIRGIPFFTFSGNIDNGSNIIELLTVEDIRLISKNDTVQSIDDSGVKLNSGVAYINFDDYEIVMNDNATATVDEQDFIIYPKGSKLVASKIIGYYLNKQNANGLQSETIGTYSYQAQDLINGIPADIAKTIVQFQSWS